MKSRNLFLLAWCCALTAFTIIFFTCAAPKGTPGSAPTSSNPTGTLVIRSVTDTFTPTTDTSQNPTNTPTPEKVISECSPSPGEGCKLGDSIELRAKGNFDPKIAVVQILENSPEKFIYIDNDKKIYAVHSYVNLRFLDKDKQILSDFKENPMTITISSPDVWNDLALSFCIANGNNPDACQKDNDLLNKYKDLCAKPSEQCAQESDLFLFDSTVPDLKKAWGILPTDVVGEGTSFQLIGTIETLQVGDPRVGCCR